MSCQNPLLMYLILDISLFIIPNPNHRLKSRPPKDLVPKFFSMEMVWKFAYLLKNNRDSMDERLLWSIPESIGNRRSRESSFRTCIQWPRGRCRCTSQWNHHHSTTMWISFIGQGTVAIELLKQVCYYIGTRVVHWVFCTMFFIDWTIFVFLSLWNLDSVDCFDFSIFYHICSNKRKHHGIKFRNPTTECMFGLGCRSCWWRRAHSRHVL